MSTLQVSSFDLTLEGVYVPKSVIDKLDRSLPALYGLIEAALAIIQEQLPSNSETALICAGLVTYYFDVYHDLDEASLLFLVSSRMTKDAEVGTT